MRNLIVKHPNCSAGIWFGLIGWLVWQAIVIIIYHRLPDGSFIMGLFPGGASCAIGTCLGGKIVSEATTRSKSDAVRRGMTIMFLSLLFYCLLVSSLTGIMDWSAVYALSIFTEFMMVGLIGFGWLIALVGAIGGWFLYLAPSGPASNSIECLTGICQTTSTNPVETPSQIEAQVKG